MPQPLDVTGEELVLVHLLDSPRGTEGERHPSATQSGISAGTGLDRSYVSVVMRKAVGSGTISRSLERVSGSKRKVAAFRLTPHGFERALSVKQRLMGATVRVRAGGSPREMEMREALKLFGGETAASLAAKVARGVPDADAGVPISAEIGEARRLVAEGRHAECAAMMRVRAGRWIRSGFQDDYLSVLASVDRERIPREDADALLLTEADLHETRGDWERARMCLEMVEGEGAPTRAEVLFRLGVLAYHRNDMDAAKEAYYRALAMSGGGSQLRGRVINAIGVMCWAREQADEAARRFADAEALALETGDAEGLMRARSNMGILAADDGDTARAIDCYARAITVAEALPDLRTVCSLYSNIGDVYAGNNDVSGAKRFYWRSMELAERLSFTWQIAELHRSLARVTEGEERGEHLKKALELFTKLGAEREMFSVRGMMGEKL